jgi:hypothetical protein
VGALAAHAMVPIAVLVAFGMTAADTGDSYEEFFVLKTRWYLPPTIAMAAVFYWAQALAARRVAKEFEELPAIAALVATGSAGITLVYALDVGRVWYGPAVASLGWAYAVAAIATTGSRWAGQRYLGLLGLAATTLSWALFEGRYADFPRHGAAVHLAAAAFYFIAAGVTKERFPLLPDVATDENGRPKALDVDAAVPLFYAGALTLGIGAYEITSAAHGAAAITAQDTTWIFFASSLATGLIAATMRWWWHELRLHGYAVAFGVSSFVLAVAASSEGQVTAMLAVYASFALALALWEREPLGLAPAAAYAFCAVLAAWRFYEPNDAGLPLIFSGTAGAMFVASALRRPAAERLGLPAPSSMWAKALQAIAFAYATAAPVVGGARLLILVDADGLIDGVPFEETLLFRLSALSVALLAIAGATTRLWWKELKLPVYATALAMSLAAALASSNEEGQWVLLLIGFGALSLALSIWEREPLALIVPAGFGFAALLVTWHHYEPHEAYLPLAVSGIAWALSATAIALRPAARSLRWNAPVGRWRLALDGLSLAYAFAAPIAGWLLLAALADPEGLIDGQRFETTLLYQTSAASVALLGLLLAAHWPMLRRLELALAASALLLAAGLLEIGHLRPDNAQAYTAPLGAYLLVLSLIALRVRGLPQIASELVPAGEVLGASMIMGPSFVQSLDAEAWRYGLILLSEGIGFVVLALVQRRVWLLGTATTFVVMDGAHYLFFAGGPALPNWAILAIAGTAVMAAGTAILLGRERWTVWQHAVQSWWYREATGNCNEPRVSL